MNLCFVCHNYPPVVKVGGIEIFTQSLSRGLVQRGHKVTIVGFARGYDIEIEEEDEGVRVLRLPPIKRGVFPDVLQKRLKLESAIRAVIRRYTIDLVECPDVNGSLVRGHFGVPLVVRMHGANFVYFSTTDRKPHRLVPFFEKRTLSLADHLVAVSHFIRHATLNLAGIQNRECEVIYNGIDTKLFSLNLAFNRDVNRILFVGRLSETKGAPNLFCALPMIFRQFPNSYLRFIGKDPIDEFGHKSSYKLIASLPEEYRARVEILGEISHEYLPQEYRSAAIAVFPSRAEAHPLAVLEAMACGTPTIFMNTGPGPEMIHHEEDGILCNTDSPAAIAGAISRLLNHPEWAQSLGVRAAERVNSTLSVSFTTSSNEAYYRKCLQAKL